VLRSDVILPPDQVRGDEMRDPLGAHDVDAGSRPGMT
jgi:hypothetical protein